MTKIGHAAGAEMSAKQMLQVESVEAVGCPACGGDVQPLFTKIYTDGRWVVVFLCEGPSCDIIDFSVALHAGADL